MSSNTAAWIVAEKVRPLELKPAPLGTPAENKILVKNQAVAINPIDGKLQYNAIYPLNYPDILGIDLAGEVVAVGSGVTRFKPGDRVAGAAMGFDSKKIEEKAFQEHTVLHVDGASHIPASMSYETAAVIPLGLSTAAAGLFAEDLLALDLPTVPSRPLNGKTILIWGGASSVGCNAIQLVVAAGYEVITTASPKNFDLVKRLGASQVFDYNKQTIVSDLVDAFKGKTRVGVYDAIAGSVWPLVTEFVQKTEGPKFIGTIARRFPEPPAGVSMKHIYAPSIFRNNIGKAVWEDWLPKALEAGTYVAAPDPKVVGHGLENIQTGIDLIVKGVSAQKLVVTL